MFAIVSTLLRYPSSWLRSRQQLALENVARRKVGLPEDGPELSTAAFRRPEGAQLGLAL
jgi:hypothetical protein